VPVFFVASFSAAAAVQGGALLVAAAAHGLWADGALLAPSAANASSSGKSGSLGAFAAWPAPAQGGAVVVTVRVALSYTSLAAAAANLAAEQGEPFALSFDEAAAAAYAAWGDALSTVVVNDVGYTDADVAAYRAARQTGGGGGGGDGGGGGGGGSGGGGGAASARITELAAAAVAAASLKVPPAPAAAASPAPSPLSAMPPLERLGSFYSSLMHAFSAPTTYSDADGAYVGLDRAAHHTTWRGGAGAFLSDLSLWDVYRTQQPLLAVLQPDVASDVFFSMLEMFAQTNYSHVPHWVWANCETGCMPGSHGLAVLADFLIKGVVGPNASAVYRAAAAQLASQDDDEDYAARGFVSVPASGAAGNGASLTLEYAFDDYCGSAIAAAAGQGADAARWRNRSANFRNVFNAAAGAMCPRFANGTFPMCPPLDLPPILLNNWYTEGDALQWSFAVPHDVPGLISLFPSPNDYVELLRGVMQNSSFWAGPLLAALPNPWLWIGNEPSLLLPWQFNWVPESAWLTQKWVRATLDTSFQLLSDGVPGNDDFGATNAWAVWACLGIYPVAATTQYAISSPCFANVTLQLPADAARRATYAHAPRTGSAPVPLLIIEAHNFSVANVYVASATLNGARLAKPFALHGDLFPALAAPRPGEDAAAHAARLAAGGGPSRLEVVLTDTPGAWA
jgi:putative alpha-1,2-mannosidase